MNGLRDAAAAARDAGDTELEATALFALGSALIHAAKGNDEEGSAALHRAIAAAEGAGTTASKPHRTASSATSSSSVASIREPRSGWNARELADR